ncbi:MAG: hypothetical protein ACPGYV_12890, partial [Phycisphaeraceae bacterium]
EQTALSTTEEGDGTTPALESTGEVDGEEPKALPNAAGGAALALALAMMSLIAGWAVVSGMSLSPVGRAILNKRFVLAWLVLLVGAWGYKAAAVAAGG